MAITGSVRAIRAGRAAIELGLRDKTGPALRGVARRFQSWASGLGKGVALGGLGGGALAAGATAAGYKLVRLASDMEEAINLFDVTFEKSSEATKDWAFTFAESVGRSKLELLESLGIFKMTADAMGIAHDKGVELSKSLTELAVDTASLRNKADAEVLERFASAIVGNHEAVRLLGVGLTETAIKAEALERGLDPETLSEANKVIIRANLLVRRLSKAHGDATRTAHQFANQWRILHAQLVNAALDIGQLLLPIATKWIQKLNAAIKVVRDFIRANADVNDMWELVVAGFNYSRTVIAKWGVQVGIELTDALQKMIFAINKHLNQFRLNVVKQSQLAASGAAAPWIQLSHELLAISKTSLGKMLFDRMGLLPENFDKILAGMGSRINKAGSMMSRGLATGNKAFFDQMKSDMEDLLATLEEDEVRMRDKFEAVLNPMIEKMNELREEAERTGSAISEMATEGEKAEAAAPAAGPSELPSTLFRSAIGTSQALYNIQQQQTNTAEMSLEQLRRQTALLDRMSVNIGALGAV